MKKIYILQIATLTLGFTTKAQEPVSGCPKIIFHSFQVGDSGCDDNVKRVGLSLFSNKVTIKYRNKEKEFISEDSVWGIRRKNDYPSRLFKGDYYRLYQLSPVYKYSKRVGKSTNYYFSNTLDSPIYSYTQEMVKKYTDSFTYNIIAKEAEINRHELTMDICVFGTNVANYDLVGGEINIKYYHHKKLATGLYINMAGKKIKDTFSFSIKKPSLLINEIGWLNQYDLLQKNNFRIAANLITGVAISELFEKTVNDASKKIAENYQFLISPGTDISLKLFSNKHNPDFYITGKAKYCFAIGNTAFGMPSMFSGYTFALGLSLIGFDREQF